MTIIKMKFERVERIKKVNGLDPNFMSRISYLESNSELPPFRAYIHSSAAPAFSPTAHTNLEEQVRENLLLHLGKNFNLVKDFDFLITAAWGDNKDKMLDIFGYSGIKENWLNNPGISFYVLRNGVLSQEKEITCGDTLIVLGEEEKYRRTTLDLTSYIENPPKIEGLEVI